MILPQPKCERRRQDSILPLINIVFLLLIFFMLAGTLTTRPPFVLKSPETSYAKSANLEPELLFIAADGRMALGSVPVRIADLPARLGDRDPTQPLQIKADAALPAREMIRILAALSTAGFAQVQLLTRNNPP